MKADLRRAIVLVALAAVTECGGSTSGDSGSGGGGDGDGDVEASYQAWLKTCSAFCEGFVAEGCAHVTLSECVSGFCNGIDRAMGAYCLDAFAAHLECWRSVGFVNCDQFPLGNCISEHDVLSTECTPIGRGDGGDGGTGG